MSVIRYASTTLPTPVGPLLLVVYREVPAEGTPADLTAEPKEHMALVAGDPTQLAGERVLCRIHSECWTGETIGSLKCDCREQLDRAIAAIVKAGRGVVVYLRQEGRGIGLGNKIRAYALQEQGADTVEANEALGFAPDLRSYDLAAAILRDLDVRSVELMTNNPDKLAGLEAAGVPVLDRVALWGADQEHNKEYLEVKRQKLGHKV